MAQTYPNLMHVQAAQRGVLNTPPEENFDTQAMQGSMQQFLADNLGQYVVIEFLVGTQGMERKEGLLYAVGRSVVTLYEEQSQTFVVCDIFSVKFVTFYLPGRRPNRVAYSSEGYAPVRTVPTPYGGVRVADGLGGTIPAVDAAPASADPQVSGSDREMYADYRQPLPPAPRAGCWQGMGGQ